MHGQRHRFKLPSSNLGLIHMSQPTPYLSVVAASRNDDHGGDPLIRTQIFINCFVRQCEKYHLPSELILIDWNPVPDRPGLAAMLQLPSPSGYCTSRVISVPASLHSRVKYGDKLAFFQMIAKNAGIRRARGRFILATNIDIVFSDELMSHIARQKLDPGSLLRVDRYDIQSDLPVGSSLDEVLHHAWTRPVRSNHRSGPRDLVEHLYGRETFKRRCQPDPDFCRGIPDVDVKFVDDLWSIRPHPQSRLDNLHTNACGDFTLLSREGWETICGYPEFEAFSMNIDSLGVACAHYAGFHEVALLPPCVCFHIEHSLGSGWTPAGEKELFNRLNKKRILNPAWHVLGPLCEDIRLGKVPFALNGPDWGLSQFDLPEHPLTQDRKLHDMRTAEPTYAPGLAVISLLPAFDLDRLTLWQEREALGEKVDIAGVLPGAIPHAIQAFVSDPEGHYTEENSLMFVRHLHQRTTLHFFLNNVSAGAKLRIDPSHQVGVVEIYRMEVLDPATHEIIWVLDADTSAQLVHGGTSRPLPSSPGVPLRLISSGDDPQLHFPPLPLQSKTYLLTLELAFQGHLGTPTW